VAELGVVVEEALWLVQVPASAENTLAVAALAADPTPQDGGRRQLGELCNSRDPNSCDFGLHCSVNSDGDEFHCQQDEQQTGGIHDRCNPRLGPGGCRTGLFCLVDLDSNDYRCQERENAGNGNEGDSCNPRWGTQQCSAGLQCLSGSGGSDWSCRRVKTGRREGASCNPRFPNQCGFGLDCLVNRKHNGYHCGRDRRLRMDSVDSQTS